MLSALECCTSVLLAGQSSDRLRDEMICLLSHSSFTHFLYCWQTHMILVYECASWHIARTQSMLSTWITPWASHRADGRPLYQIRKFTNLEIWKITISAILLIASHCCCYVTAKNAALLLLVPRMTLLFHDFVLSWFQLILLTAIPNMIFVLALFVRTFQNFSTVQRRICGLYLG